MGERHETVTAQWSGRGVHGSSYALIVDGPHRTFELPVLILEAA